MIFKVRRFCHRTVITGYRSRLSCPCCSGQIRLHLYTSLLKYPRLGVPLLREKADQGRVLCAILLRQGFGGQGAPSRRRGVSAHSGDAPFCNRSPTVKAQSRSTKALSGLAGGAAFPSRPENHRARRAEEGQGGAEPPGATRSALSREHGEDGEHRTFSEASTVACSAHPAGPGQ